jgi:hypothetical protein
MLATLAAAALAANLVVDVEVPADLALDGEAVARVYRPGRLEIPVPVGAHDLAVTVAGTTTHFALTAPVAGDLRVVVGKTGITLPQLAIAEASGPGRLEIRSVGREDVLLVVDGERLPLRVGATRVFDLDAGRHPFGLRNAAGTVIWADGALDIQPGADLIVHVADGRPPELTGAGGVFVPGAR